MKQRTALIQIMHRILLMAAALADAAFSTLAANQPPTREATCLGEFALSGVVKPLDQH